MPDEIAQPVPGTAPDPSAETKTTETEREHMIPKSRFDEVNKELQGLRTAQQKRDLAERQAADEQAKQKGEWERLASERQTRLDSIEAEHTTAAERITAYEAEMERQIKARLKALPEAIRELDPGGDMLTRFAWLPKAEALAATFANPAPRAPLGTPSGPRNGGSVTSPAQGLQEIIAEKRARIGGL